MHAQWTATPRATPPFRAYGSAANAQPLQQPAAGAQSPAQHRRQPAPAGRARGEGRSREAGEILGASRCFRFCSAVGVCPRIRSAQRKNWWKLTLPVQQTGRSDTAPQSQLLRLLRLLLWCCVLSGEWCLVLGVRRSAAAALLVVLLVRHGPAEEAREEAVRHEGQVVAGVGLAQEVDHHHLQGDSSGPGEGG